MVSVRATWIVVVALLANACELNLDSTMWECQLVVQKDNAGRSEADVAQRNQDIETCMSDSGYRLDSGNPSCKPGALVSNCYRRR